MTKRLQAQRRSRLIKLPASWRPSRQRSGTFRYDVLLPAIFITLAVFTVGLIAFAMGILLKIIPYS